MGNNCWVRAFYTEPEARGEKKKTFLFGAVYRYRTTAASLG